MPQLKHCTVSCLLVLWWILINEFTHGLFQECSTLSTLHSVCLILSVTYFLVGQQILHYLVSMDTQFNFDVVTHGCGL